MSLGLRITPDATAGAQPAVLKYDPLSGLNGNSVVVEDMGALSVEGEIRGLQAAYSPIGTARDRTLGSGGFVASWPDRPQANLNEMRQSRPPGQS